VGNTTYNLYAHLHGQSRGEIPSRNLRCIADFRLKCCILKEIAKNNSTGSC
jgi:hypothetical protein